MTIETPALKALTDLDRLALAFEWLETFQFGTSQLIAADCIECGHTEGTHDADACRLSQWLADVAAIIDSRLEVREEPPTVRPIAFGALTVTIECPHCGEKHTHGYGNGHRVGHCGSGYLDKKSLGYILADAEARP